MITGIKNGMVMQRDKNSFCDITFKSDEKITNVECDSYTDVTFESLSDNTYHLGGIEAGGPYNLKINDTIFENIYVGDLWILSGQSNMQGIGRKVNIGRNENERIRAYYPEGRWDMANHPLHTLGKAKGYVHTIEFNSVYNGFKMQGVGPGLSFAEKMYELTNVPQGVIACAHGGTNLFDQWNPNKKSLGHEHSLYAAMLKRFFDNGSNAAGIFWYQGCSDTKKDHYDKYAENMINFVKCTREDMKMNLPFVQVQICRNSWGGDCDNQRMWSSIREQQRLLNAEIDNFDTISTIALELEDCIHLNAASQKIVGNDAAESMFCLINKRMYNCLPGITLRNIEIIEDGDEASTIIIEFDNVHGSLLPASHALGFDMSENELHEQSFGVNNAYCDGNRVILSSPICAKNLVGRHLWYGFGTNPSCNVIDSKGRSIPAFGPIRL